MSLTSCCALQVLAVAWWRHAAAHGSASALNNLGICFEDGLGVAVDMQAAHECYRRVGGHSVVVPAFSLAPQILE